MEGTWKDRYSSEKKSYQNTKNISSGQNRLQRERLPVMLLEIHKINIYRLISSDCDDFKATKIYYPTSSLLVTTGFERFLNVGFVGQKRRILEQIITSDAMYSHFKGVRSIKEIRLSSYNKGSWWRSLKAFIRSSVSEWFPSAIFPK